MGKKSGPTAANTVKKNLSMLFNFAIKREMGVTFNPARYADRRKENADGYHTWTDQEIARFKEHHPTGSKARLAMMLFLMLPMLLFQAALAEPLVATVFGQKWLPASSTIAALALLYCLSSVAELNNYVLFALGHSRWPPLLGILQLSLAVILAACFSQYGLLAMSLSFAAAYLLMLPWSQHLACKAMDLPWTTFLVALQPVLAGAAALLLTLYAMARWWQGSAIVLLVLALFAGAIAYLLPMLLLGRALRGTAGGFDPFSLLRQLRNLKHRGAAAD